MARKSWTMLKRLVLVGLVAGVTVTAGADQILLDNGATQLNVGTTANDGTGDTMRAGALKMKQWAADLNTMATELYAVTTGSAFYIKNCPGVALDGTTDDAPAINACIAAEPEGTMFIFPSGVTIGLKSPLTGFKSRQLLMGNSAKLQAITVTSALGATLANGATSATVADRTGFTCGQILKAGSRNGSTSATLTNSFSVVTGTAGAGNCAPATGSGALYVSPAFTTCGTLGSDGSCGATPSITTGAGVNVISSGVLIYNSSTAVTDLTIAGFTLDGARPSGGNVDVRIPRWEPDKLVETGRGGRAHVYDIVAQNADGDGISIAGDYSVVSNVRGADIGGNLVHFSEGDYQRGTGIAGTNINLAGGFLGHQDGMITYSNKCNYSVLSDLNAYNAKRIIGGLDAYGGTHFVAENLVGTNLTDGPFAINNASTTATGTVTSGSAVITGLASARGWLPGMNVSGTGIPANTYIVSAATTANTVTMSANATSSGTPTITLSGGASDITIANGIFDNSQTTTGVIKLSGATTDGNRLRGLRVDNLVGKNTVLWASGIEASRVSMTLDNAGRSTLYATTSHISALLSDIKDSVFDLRVEGGATGVYAGGSTTRNLTITGTYKNPQGNNSEAVYLASDLPATPEVHLSGVTVLIERELGTAWAASTAYSAGNIVSNSGNNYIARVAGTSAASGGPTTLSPKITDGTVTWGYLNTPGRFPTSSASTGIRGINASAGFRLSSSAISATSGDGPLYTQPRGDAILPTIEIVGNSFPHIVTNSCCHALWFSGGANRLLITDNVFSGYDTTTDHVVYTSTGISFDDVVFARNSIDSNRYGTAASVVRFRGTVTRGVFKDNILPYRSGAGAGWTTPTTWAEQEVTVADPIRLESVVDTLVIGNVMRKATAQ